MVRLSARPVIWRATVSGFALTTEPITYLKWRAICGGNAGAHQEKGDNDVNENAQELLAAAEEAKQAIAARITELRTTIAQCNEELVTLGAKRVRKVKAEGKKPKTEGKRGRPKGSKNKPVPVPDPAPVSEE